MTSDNNANHMRDERRETLTLDDLKWVSFRQKNQHIEIGLNADKENFSPLFSVQASISPLTHDMNSSMEALSRLFDEGEELAQRLSGSDNKEEFRQYFLRMKKEYQVVADIARPIAALPTLVTNGTNGKVRPTAISELPRMYETRSI